MKKVIIFICVLLIIAMISSCILKRSEGIEEANNETNYPSPSFATNIEGKIEKDSPTPTVSQSSAPSPTTSTPIASPSNSPTPTIDPSEQPKPENVIFTSNPVLSDKNLLYVMSEDNTIKIKELVDGNFDNEVFTENCDYWVPWYIHNNLILMSSDNSIGLFDISSSLLVNEIKNAYPRGFFKDKPYILYETYDEINKIPYINIYDYSSHKLIKVFEGYSATISILDDSVYFLTNNIEGQSSEGNPYGSINICSFNVEDGSISTGESIKIDDQTYSIRDLASLSRDYYVYSLYDANEIRYYNNKGDMIMSDDTSDGGNNFKEQFHFSFSIDGEKACLSERNWNSLTYIVYGDSQSSEMIKTNYLGSFPFIVNGKIFFLSDPSFVNLGEREDFSQIGDYALYEYDMNDKKLSMVLHSGYEVYLLERD